MLNIDATDKIEGIASVADKVEFTCSVVDGTDVKSSEGLLSNSQTQIYLATGATRILSLTLVNTHTSAVTVNVQKDPTDAGTLYRIIPKDLSLGIGYMLVFDGQRCTVMDASGRILKGYDLHASEHANAGADEISVAGLSGLLADDQHVLDAEVLNVAAAKGANADITSITRATGGAFNISIGGAAGDDFIVDTNKLVAEGDTGNVGIGTTAPGAALHINTAIATGQIIERTTGGSISTQYKNVDDSTGFYLGISSSEKFAIGRSIDLNVSNLVTVQNNGNVGIGTMEPGNPLAVNRSGDGIIVDFESADVVEGTIAIAGNTTSYNAFVGSHYTQLKQGQKELPIGAVVVSTGEIIPCEANIPEVTEEKTEIAEKDSFETIDIEVDEYIEKFIDGKLQKVRTKIGEEFREYRVVGDKVEKIIKPIYKKITIPKSQLKKDHELNSQTGKIYKTIRIEEIISRNVSSKEYFTYIDTTIKSADKRAYGVWFDKMSDDTKGMSFGQDNKPVYLIAQVGLFKIRVTDTNGNIEVGDFLETSTRPMEAQKQNSPDKLNSSIAKALVSVDFSKIEVNPELGYKWKLISAIF